MGQAFDQKGNVLDEAYGATKKEVFDQLIERNPDAHEIRVRALEQQDQPVEATPQPYAISPRVRTQIEKSFNYHAPHGDQPDRYEQIRAWARAGAHLIACLSPESREQSNALTRLDEVVMHANAAIARNEPRP